MHWRAIEEKTINPKLASLAKIFFPFFRRAADRITSFYSDLMGAECKPLTMGGDHFVTYPILRAIAEKHGPVGRQ